ncbi:MAG: LptF/LptG family permease [Rhabdochlamydiaceae bacterium]|nr:LptF/LptG family permease [Candidatus Amphrikana amoebophyrae]
MIYSSIQTKYIVNLMLKRFFTLLSLFYLTYVIFDLSINISHLSEHASLSKIVLYYLFNFIKRVDLLIPLSLMFTTINVLTTLNIHNELLAFQTTGRTIKRIVKPIIVMSIVCSLFVLACYQSAFPHAQSFIDGVKHNNSEQARLIGKKNLIHTISYDNGSKLLFSDHNFESKTIRDAYFIISSNDIWHFKELKEINNEIYGYFVDHMKKNSNGVLQNIDSFPKLKVSFINSPLFSLTDQEKEPFENYSITALFTKFLRPYDSNNKQYHEISTQLFSKLSMPWFSLLIALAVIPFCTKFSRMHKNYFIYTLSLLGFVSFFTITDACVILGENNILSPALAVFGPIATLLTLFGIRFASHK